MEGYLDTLEQIETRLAQIQASRLVGICFLDAQHGLVQYYDEDPALREAITEHYQERIRQMRLSGLTLKTGRPVSYPRREE